LAEGVGCMHEPQGATRKLIVSCMEYKLASYD
jgi:hypothetical protein